MPFKLASYLPNLSKKQTCKTPQACKLACPLKGGACKQVMQLPLPTLRKYVASWLQVASKEW